MDERPRQTADKPDKAAGRYNWNIIGKKGES